VLHYIYDCAECHYAVCHYAECRGALGTPSLNSNQLGQSVKHAERRCAECRDYLMLC
jgi:hypothetical protein